MAENLANQKRSRRALRDVPCQKTHQGGSMMRNWLLMLLTLAGGDHYFTSDYPLDDLTAWGFADGQHDRKHPGHGSTLGRLLLRSLPGGFTDFTDKSTMKEL